MYIYIQIHKKHVCVGSNFFFFPITKFSGARLLHTERPASFTDIIIIIIVIIIIIIIVITIVTVTSEKKS